MNVVNFEACALKYKGQPVHGIVMLLQLEHSSGVHLLLCAWLCTALSGRDPVSPRMELPQPVC